MCGTQGEHFGTLDPMTRTGIPIIGGITWKRRRCIFWLGLSQIPVWPIE